MKTSIKLNLKFYFPFAFFLLCTLYNFAQPPANDNCTAAILVSTYPYSDLGGVYTSVNTSGATRSTPNPSCVTSSDNNDDVWYKFVAGTEAAALRVHSALAGNAYSTLGYALYDGCSGTEIACNNLAATYSGYDLLGGLTPGNTYYLRFWAQYNFTNLTFSFCVQDINPVVGPDESASALTLNINAPGEQCIAPQFYTTATATRSSPNPNCTGDNDDDIWFQFTCPANSVTIITEKGVENTTGAFATMGMEIIDASAGISTSCTAIYPAGSTTLLSGITGHVYKIRIWSYGNGSSPVTFSMCMQQGYNVYPVNDACSAATALVIGAGTCTTSDTGNLCNANTTAGLTNNPSCASPSSSLTNDVWYSVTIPSTGNVVIQSSATHSAVNDVVMQAYSGTCGLLTQIACDEDGNPDVFPSAKHARISLTGRTPGEVVLVRVVPRNSENKGEFSICAFDETPVVVTPSITIIDAVKTEGNAGTKQLKLKVNLSNATTQQVQVSYTTSNINATAPSDYIASNGVLTFIPGDTAETISITINGDVTAEPDEAFRVRLLNPVNATIADATGYGAIRNDDGPAPAVLNNTEVSEMISKTAVTVKVYPNPVTDLLQVEIPANVKPGNLIISDMAGHIIKQVVIPANQSRLVIGTGNFARGSYILNIQSGNLNTRQTFIKQ